MSALKRIIPHDHVTEYAAGTLAPEKTLMINCQQDICSKAAIEIQNQETIAAGFMMSTETTREFTLSDDFMSRALAALPQSDSVSTPQTHTDQTPTDQEPPLATAANDLLPATLTAFMGGEPVNWSFFAPGMQSASLWQGNDGQHLWLLKVKGGKNMPEHTHIGEEWSLILKGSYHVGTTQYTRGDLHVEDEHCTHIPMIDPGVDCICLVLTEGPLKPTRLLPKLLMPFARI